MRAANEPLLYPVYLQLRVHSVNLTYRPQSIYWLTCELLAILMPEHTD